MISTLALALAPLAAPASLEPAALPTGPFALAVPAAQDGGSDPAAEYSTRLTAAGKDVARLLALADWCKEQGLQMEMAGTFEKVLELDEANEVAHKGLRHHNYDGKWFKTYVELSKYKRAEEKRMLEEHGMVRFQDGWAKQEAVPYLRMGWVEDGNGGYVSPRVLAERERDADLTAKGWQRQADQTWVSPDEVANWQKNLVKVGEKWMTNEEANEFHSQVGQWWTLPSEHFVVYSTNDYETTWWSGQYADQTYPNLVRAFGLEPEEKPVLLVLNSIAQYNDFAAGNQAAGRPAAEVDGSSSVHHAFFANAWFEIGENYADYAGRGIAYWDRKDPKLDPWGQYAVRHAAALSYAEAIDPSLDTVSRAVEGGGQNFQVASFWQEKRIPRWLHYGVASYCETYFRDENTPDNSWWARDFALDQLKKKGGLGPLDAIFAFQLDPNDPAAGNHLIAQAGFLVSFILDGGCGPVEEAHEAFRAALADPEADAPAAAQALQKALVDNEAAVRAKAPEPEKKAETAAGEGTAASTAEEKDA